MKISKLSLENFKKFRSRFEFDLSDQNFLVGENNTGKTTLIEALVYLLNGPQKDKKYKCHAAPASEHIVVEAIVSGDFTEMDAKYQDYIFSHDGIDCIKLKRSDEEGEVDQPGKKGVKLNESRILCWSEDRQQFENPSGKDTTFNVIDVVPIYANDHVDNVVSFDSSKILGKLIKNSVGDFFETPDYRTFKDHHNEIFNTGPNSLKSRLNILSSEISDILREQWGELELNFKFDLADSSNHLKKGSVLIKEYDVEHELGDKGSGLQRSVMLSMIQVLSRVRDLENDNNLVLCIDEPELNLHPTAQTKLAEALQKISANIQIIVSTHSPYMLKSFRKKADSVYVFKSAEFADSSKLETVSILPFGPTLAEIQYFAYNLKPNDLHNELFGYLEAESRLKFDNTKKWLDERDLKRFAKEKGISVAEMTTTQKNNLKKDVSLQTYIRHYIHHPENTHNREFTEAEMGQSIQEMITAIKSLPL
jgi:predicted ATPase